MCEVLTSALSSTTNTPNQNSIQNHRFTFPIWPFIHNDPRVAKSKSRYKKFHLSLLPSSLQSINPSSLFLLHSWKSQKKTERWWPRDLPSGIIVIYDLFCKCVISLSFFIQLKSKRCYSTYYIPLNSTCKYLHVIRCLSPVWIFLIRQ